MTVSELCTELEYYLDKYGDAEISIVKTNKDMTGYDYGTVYRTDYYDEFYIIADFDGSGCLCVQ
jgi:hypothetical protein